MAMSLWSHLRGSPCKLHKINKIYSMVFKIEKFSKLNFKSVMNVVNELQFTSNREPRGQLTTKECKSKNFVIIKCNFFLSVSL